MNIEAGCMAVMLRDKSFPQNVGKTVGVISVADDEDLEWIRKHCKVKEDWWLIEGDLMVTNLEKKTERITRGFLA